MQRSVISTHFDVVSAMGWLAPCGSRLDCCNPITSILFVTIYNDVIDVNSRYYSFFGSPYVDQGLTDRIGMIGADPIKTDRRCHYVALFILDNQRQV